MPRVDFYHLSRDPASKVVPLLAEKALESGQQLSVVMAGEEQQSEMARALWEAAPESFLANAMNSEEAASSQPILIGDAPASTNGASIVALADGIWRDEALEFQRVLYLFTERHIDAARENWRRFSNDPKLSCHFWKQQGGKWVEAG